MMYEGCTTKYSPFWDKTMGMVLVLCALIGTPANTLALRYFYTTRRMGELTVQLCISICCIDICTSFAHIPVAISLLNGRSPVLFSNIDFCVAWDIVFPFLQKISMFLVMLLSISRCIAIALPNRNINEMKNWFLLAFVIYSLVPVVTDLMLLSQTRYVYSLVFVYPFAIAGSSIAPFNNALDIIEVGIPPVISFICFIICCQKLSSPGPTEASNERKRRAAVTVTMFTGLFLVCNMPYFVNKLLFKVLGGNNPIFCNQYMHWYSWPVCKVLCTVLNAVLNPVLYYYRVPGLRKWISGSGAVVSVDNGAATGIN